MRNIGTESSAKDPDTEIRRPKPALLTGPGSQPSPELVARLERQRAAMRAYRCPTCGNEPVEARARFQQRQDLAIVWLYPDPDQHGAVVEKHHCAGASHTNSFRPSSVHCAGTARSSPATSPTS